METINFAAMATVLLELEPNISNISHVYEDIEKSWL
jgi:hypothetical protein